MPRRSRWLDDFALLSPAASGQASAELDTPMAGELHVMGHTIVRVILRVQATLNTLGAIANLTYGLVLMNSEAVSAGAFPDPSGVDEVPWIVRDRLSYVRDADAGNQEIRVSYDLRAMRKYTGQSSLQMIADADAASSWDVRVTSRVLVLMP